MFFLFFFYTHEKQLSKACNKCLMNLDFLIVFSGEVQKIDSQVHAMYEIGS